MSDTSESLKINPLFGDVLGGTFRFPVGDGGKDHTAARLAVATYVKGDQDDVLAHEYEFMGSSRLLAARNYRPSWAQHVAARVLYRPFFVGGEVQHDVAAFGLRAEQRSLTIATKEDLVFMNIDVGPENVNKQRVLSLEGVDAIQRLVTQEVQLFFFHAR